VEFCKEKRGRRFREEMLHRWQINHALDDSEAIRTVRAFDCVLAHVFLKTRKVKTVVRSYSQ
jgi:hypothetical protein